MAKYYDHRGELKDGLPGEAPQRGTHISISELFNRLEAHEDKRPDARAGTYFDIFKLPPNPATEAQEKKYDDQAKNRLVEAQKPDARPGALRDAEEMIKYHKIQREERNQKRLYHAQANPSNDYIHALIREVYSLRQEVNALKRLSKNKIA
mgnify:CR=1 FL=1